jgi:hypothetical protein
VAEFDVCQCNKGETVKGLRILQPLQIPLSIWRDIYMGFIVRLPESRNKSFIMVVVDHVSKYAYLCVLRHPLTSHIVDQVFMDNIFIIHGMAHSIVSNMDLTCVNNFCKKLFKLQGTQLHLKSVYHPKTNDQNEIVNKCLETYLQCFAYD